MKSSGSSRVWRCGFTRENGWRTIIRKGPAERSTIYCWCKMRPSNVILQILPNVDPTLFSPLFSGWKGTKKEQKYYTTCKRLRKLLLGLRFLSSKWNTCVHLTWHYVIIYRANHYCDFVGCSRVTCEGLNWHLGGMLRNWLELSFFSYCHQKSMVLNLELWHRGMWWSATNCQASAGCELACVG